MSFAASVPVVVDEFSATLSRTRQWFERYRIEPESFDYDLGEITVFIKIAFRFKKEAAAFASAFGGHVINDNAN